MYKYLLFTFVGLLLGVEGNAQYANSWVNFGQQYYKIPIGKDGIYRLTYSNLQTAGFPVSSVNPNFIQLFHRGVEQAIVVQGETDGSFDAADYVEFYGQRNDGTLDAQLYQPSSNQPHPYYNLYSDTAAYFLTWNIFAQKGKRMNTFTQVNVSGIPKETSQQEQELDLYVAEYSGGNTTSNGEIQSSAFDEGEGWTDHYICTQNSGCTGFQNYIIQNLTNIVSSDGNPHLDMLIVGRDELNHQTQVYVGPDAGSLRLIATQTFVNFQTQLVSIGLAPSDIGADGKMTVQVKALGVGGVRDKISVSFIKVTFPQSFDLTGQTKKWLRLNPDPSGKSYIEITNPVSSLRLWDITDTNNLTVIGTNLSGNILSAVVPNTTIARTLYTSNEVNAASLQSVAFQQINPASYDYIIITHNSLLGASQAYADYRASSSGGNYHPLTITVDQLYNQFNYGEISPLGIFQFMKFMVENGAPKYLFLIGKGRDVSAGLYRETSIPASELRDLVPSAGLPASDMAYTSNLNGSGFGPAVPTGRLSASTSVQITAYLSKIKETEAAPLNMLWRKQGLHLSGGIQPVELTDFRSYMDAFKTIAEGEYWGGKITTIAKHDPEAVQQINISDQVNAGVNLVTFFGHSSPGTIDIDIGYASDPTLGYNNPGKYPVFLINGCNAGNFFSDGTSFGEDWMLTPGKGARGFIAHSFFGFVNNLKNYTTLFYSIGFGDSTFIQKGVGDVQQEVARQYLLNNGTDMADVTQVQQMVLLGDPAIKLFGTAKPDYETDDTAISMVSLDGKPVTALSDSFAIKVIVKNFGAVKETPLQVRLVRTYNDNTTRTYDSTFAPVYQQDTLAFKIIKDKATGFGNNQFTVTLDYANKILELNESNNTGTASFVIPLGGTQNLYPVPYGIVNQSATTLLFQSTDPLTGTRDFQIQVDTSANFNSPYLIQQKVSGNVLARFPINLLGKDSLVYYWRTKFDQPKPNESILWTTSSFTFINDSPLGWMQKKFPQLQENSVSGLVSDLPTQQLRFIENSSTLLVTTYGWNNPAPYTDVSVKINNTEYNLSTQGQPCRNNTINFVAFNKTTLVPYAGLPFDFQDPRTCGREPQVINSFLLSEMETGNGDDVAAMIDNIQTSDSVLIFSVGNPGYSFWSPALLSKLNSLGIQQTQLSSLQAGDPLIILGRKDAPAGTAKVFTTSGVPADTQELQVAASITGRYTSGKMTSVLVGPALHWNKLIAQVGSIQTSDQYNFNLLGVKLDGTETLLQNNTGETMDLTAIDATQYPYLRLELQTQDDINLSPVQLNKWVVLYDPVAEGVLLFTGPATGPVLAEGQPWSGSYKFVNISAQQFTDSLTVDFEVFTQRNLSKQVNNFRIKAPLPGDTTTFSVTTGTQGKAGLNDVDVFVNRKILPEQYYDNNVIDLGGYLNVKADSIAPVLDVTVDGRYLINDDYVSPNPLIVIKIKDENHFLLKTDTLGVRIVITYPCPTVDCTGRQIYFTDSEVRWFAATATTDFRIEYSPKNLPEGEYTLYVQAADETGNTGGAGAYQINFQVKNETTFTFQSVYPNPSTTVFFFNFVITGNETPDNFELEVFALDGRPLQQFNIQSIADFHIGDNQLIWNATDLSGNPLPSGMYVFRLRVNIQSKEYKQTGKLILIR